MKKCICSLPLWLAILCATFFSCEQEDHSLTELQGTISFGGISLEFAPMSSTGGRMTGNSPWIHVFPNSAELIFTHKVTGKQYVLEYNPNDFSVPYTINLPFGAYAYHSIVQGGVFSAFLPFEARGEFLLSSKSLELTLEAETEYGLVTVKDQYVEKASITEGEYESDLLLQEDSNYWFLYVRGETAVTLKIKESFEGSTISRELNIKAYRHYNFVLRLNEGATAIIGLIMAPFELVEEEILIGPSSMFSEENGTIKCPEASPGEKGRVNEKVYEAVDRALLIKRRDEGADLSCVCTSLVTDMSIMFAYSSNFNQPIGNWDVGNVTNMSEMFHSATTFNQPIGNWDVGNVTDMRFMFLWASNFNQPIGNWDVSNVTNMGSMFQAAHSFNQPIGNWDVRNVTDMSAIFAVAASFNQPIGDWNVSNVTNMSGMFNMADNFNQPIGNWDVSSVTEMGGMFQSATNFNQPIGNWDVGNVKRMSWMFYNTNNFNQPIGGWDLRNVTNMYGMFQEARNFNQPIGNWDVSNVTDMSYIFYNSIFNQPIGNWNVSNVTNMVGMFGYAYSFNQPIGNWDVSKVIDMSNIFYFALNFNQDISSWCVQNIPSEPTNFSTASALLEANKPVWGTCPD